MAAESNNNHLIPDLNNYFDEYVNNNCEIVYYETAFPVLNNISEIVESSTTSKSLLFKHDEPKLSTAHNSMMKQQSINASTMDTFIIPYEERKYVDGDVNGSNLKRNLKDICGQNNVRLETSVQADQSLRVFITGTTEKVLEAKKKIQRILQTQLAMQLPIPKEFHRHLIGAKGAKLKELESDTGAQISIPKPNENADFVTIKGTKDQVEHARQSIQRIVDEVSKIGREIVEIDRRFHQLVCHSNNTSLHVVIQRKNLRLDIPPFSLNKNQISISGDKEGVNIATSIIKQTYEDMRSKYQELMIEITKEKHKYIIGPKGSGTREILDKTGVWVQVNGAGGGGGADASANTVTLLGPKDNLGLALTEVFRKSEGFKVENIAAPGWVHKFIIGKNGSNLKEWTSNKPELNLSFERNKGEITIEGPTEEVDEVGKHLREKVFDLQTRLSHLEIEVDRTMIKHIIGSKGSNIQKISETTQCSINIINELSRTMLDIIGPPDKVEEAKTALLHTIEQIQNTKRVDVIFPHDLIPQLIGQNGRGLKPIKDQYPDVRIVLPNQNEDSDIITLIGPRADVDNLNTWFKKKKNELVESNFSLKVNVPHKFHKIIIGREGITIRELTKTHNVKFDIPLPELEKNEITIIGRQADVEAAEKKVLNIVQKEQNIVEVQIEIPKNLHTMMIGKGGSRVNALKEECGGQVTIRFPTPQSNSNTVIVKGLKDDVSIAQSKLRDLVQELTDSNFEYDFKPSESPEYLKYLLKDPEMKPRALRDTFKIRIGESSGDKSSLHLIGQKDKVLAAKEFCEQKQKEAGELAHETLKLPMEHVEYYKNYQEELTRISNRHCCQASVPSNNGTMSPDNEEVSNEYGVIEFRGPKNYVERAMSELKEIVDDYISSVKDSLLIDSKQYDSLYRLQKQVSEIFNKHYVQFEIVSNTPDLDKEFKTNLPNGVVDSANEEESISLSPEPSLASLPNGDCSHEVGRADGGVTPTSDLSSSVYFGSLQLHQSSVATSRLPKFRIIMNGRQEKIHAVKEELVKLLPIDLELRVPEEYYPVLIGNKGSKINELRNKHNVQINIPSSNHQNGHSGSSRLQNVVVSGPSERAIQAKAEIEHIVEELNKQREERARKNFRDTVKVPVIHHAALIGMSGSNISKIRNKHQVRINIPTTEPISEEIIIFGPQDNVIAAKEDILKFVHRLESRVIEDLNIDSRVHSRLIGSRGANLEQLRKRYRCEIVFPTRGSEGLEANIVKIKGTKEEVDKCADELVERAMELLDDIVDLPPSQPNPIAIPSQSQQASNHNQVQQSNSFRVLNGPWEDWADIHDDNSTRPPHQPDLAPGSSGAGEPSSTNTMTTKKWNKIVQHQ